MCRRPLPKCAAKATNAGGKCCRSPPIPTSTCPPLTFGESPLRLLTLGRRDAARPHVSRPEEQIEKAQRQIARHAQTRDAQGGETLLIKGDPADNRIL
jgi:hypothetical protein